MTKPMNFPGRKQARREKALQRFRVGSPKKRGRGREIEGIQTHEARLAELDRLKRRVDQGVGAKSIRTKKSRIGRRTKIA